MKIDILIRLFLVKGRKVMQKASVILKRVVLIMVVVTGIVWGAISLVNDIRKSQPVEGFLKFIEGKDVCSLAIDGDTIWAGGSDGLYKITYQKLRNSITSVSNIESKNNKSNNINNNNNNNSNSSINSNESFSSIGNNINSNNNNNSSINRNESLSGSEPILTKDDFKVDKIGDFRFIKALLVSDGKIWIGHDEGLSVYDGKSFLLIKTDDGLPDNRVNALFKVSSGKIYAGTWGGVAVFDGQKVSRTIKKEDGLLEDMVNVISQDYLGGIWFGSYVAPRGGVSILLNDKWQYFSTKKGLLHSNINDIINTSDNDVIVGGGLYTQGGGTRFYFDKLKTQWQESRKYIKEDGLAGAKIRSLHEDAIGRLWVGSEYEGLAILSNNKSTILTVKSGLSNDEVKCFLEEKDQTIWVGTREGIVRISKGGVVDVS